MAKRKKKRPQTRHEAYRAMVKKGYLLAPSGEFVHSEVYRETYGAKPRGWVVHHIDCNHLNNDAANLIALPRIFHEQIHIQMRQSELIFPREYIEKVLSIYMDINEGVPEKIDELKREICMWEKALKEIPILNKDLDLEILKNDFLRFLDSPRRLPSLNSL